MADKPEPQHGAFSREDVQKMIDDALARQREAHTRELDQLRTQLSGAGAMATPVPEHAGGPGSKILGTWSLAEQTEQIAKRAAAARK